jgi:ribosomal protein S18 acetylase RimI-like enzyme
MLILEQISPKNAFIFKAVRLQALQDSPSAFGSTYAWESQLSDADWLKRSADWTNDTSVGYLAIDQEIACGIVNAFLDEDDPGKAHLASMWVHPTHRRGGVGRTLVTGIQKWATFQKVSLLQLTVTSSNRMAIDFYKRIGFTMTGNTQPYPNDPDAFEYEMSQSLG